ncbi:MAG TPA: nuclear transport factor 2 family protein [Phycisphaerales bacterium]|nr:nuclear transport factor 2 family protein [Phycisphaerales bacterium]
MSPITLVQQQLDTYNARDIDGFAACFSDDVLVFDLDTMSPRFTGTAALRERYGETFRKWPNQRSAVMNRQALGEFVTDLEYITGVPDRAPYAMLAVYRVRNGKIDRMMFTKQFDPSLPV